MSATSSEVLSNAAVLEETIELLNGIARRATAAGRQLTIALLLHEALRSAGGSSADAAWEPFAKLLSADTAAQADAAGYDKFTMPAKYFLFGETKAFMDGLPGMLEGGLFRSELKDSRRERPNHLNLCMIRIRLNFYQHSGKFLNFPQKF